ncbi:MAG: hypothetical protein ACK6D3_15440 [Planctomycetaceae bacterium]
MGDLVQSLNGFQRMMFRWEQHLPLNALHLVEMAFHPDPASTQRCLAETCASLGLRKVRVDDRGRSLSWDTLNEAERDEVPPLHLRSLLSVTNTSLSRAVNAELNQPFPQGTHWPIRAVQFELAGQSTYLGLVYHHLVTDARGVSLVLRDLLHRLAGLDPRPVSLDLTYPQPEDLTDDNAVQHWGETLTGLGRSLADVFALRKFRRPRPFQSGPRRICSGIHETSARLARVQGFAKALGATLGDLVLAALFEGLTLSLAKKSKERLPLALCMPVDLRQRASDDCSQVLGQMLGSLTVRDVGSPEEPFSQRVARITGETRILKAGDQAAHYALKMRLMSRLWDLAPDWINRVTGPALIPLAGCLSNINFTETFGTEYEQGLIDGYYRFSGTGPLVPLMISMTTLPGLLSLTTSHHSDVMTQTQVQRIMAHLKLRIQGELPDQSSLSLFAGLPLEPERESRDVPAIWNRAA